MIAKDEAFSTLHWKEEIYQEAEDKAWQEYTSRVLACCLTTPASDTSGRELPPPRVESRHLALSLAERFPATVGLVARSAGLEGRRLLPVLGEWLVEDEEVIREERLPLCPAAGELLTSAATPRDLALRLLTPAGDPADLTLAVLRQLNLV